eukprot:191696_1
MAPTKDPSHASAEEEGSPNPSKYESTWSKSAPIMTAKPTPSPRVWTTKSKEEPMEPTKEPSDASADGEASPNTSKYPSTWSKKPTPLPSTSTGVWTTKNKEEPMNDTMESTKEPSNASKEEENNPSPS